MMRFYLPTTFLGLLSRKGSQLLMDLVGQCFQWFGTNKPVEEMIEDTRLPLECLVIFRK